MPSMLLSPVDSLFKFVNCNVRFSEPVQKRSKGIGKSKEKILRYRLIDFKQKCFWHVGDQKSTIIQCQRLKTTIIRDQY